MANVITIKLHFWSTILYTLRLCETNFMYAEYLQLI
jgi:hypothetical protein